MSLAGKAAAVVSALILTGGWTYPAGAAEGYKYEGVKWRDRDLPMPYYVYTGKSPPTEIPVNTFVNAVKAAFQKWEDVPSSYMTFRYRGETAAYPPDVSDGRNVVGWKDNLGSAIGVNVYWTWGDYMVESDILLNRSMRWSAATPTPFTTYDLHSVLVHEAGHSLSLDDIYDNAYSDQVMFYTISSGEMRRVLGEGDKAGITFIYPKKGDLTVSEVRGPSSAMERETIELSATIQNAGSWATDPCRLKLYLSRDANVDAKDTLLGEGFIPLLEGEKEYGAKLSVVLPTVLVEQEYYVCAVVDAEEEVQEVSETNNANCYFPLKVWWDSDSDGLPNWWEIEVSLDAYDATGDNGATSDPDGDGLANIGEYQNGTNPFLADTDGDGKNDGDEVGAGTDPTDDKSLFEIAYVSVLGEGDERWVRVGWRTVLGRQYRLYYQDTPGSAWIPLGPLQTGAGTLMGQDDPEGLAQPARYYTVGVQ